MFRPIQAQIDLAALQHNLRSVRRFTTSRVLAVIKANAYGHGLLPVAHALAAADGFALLNLADGIRLRDAGFRQPILLLEGCFSPVELPLLAEYELSTVLHNATQLAWLDAYPRRNHLSVWLKINTGMNRLGFASHEIPAVMAQLKAHSAVREITLMSHFSHADEVQGVAQQAELFQQLTIDYRLPCSLANSAAVLRYPTTHAEWVRPGIMLYGASPFDDRDAAELGLQPVMTLSSQLIAVRQIQAGDIVGYAGTFRANRPLLIGTVACGYADGYPRHAATGTPILVNGQRTRTLGRVSMDMLSVDLSAVQNAKVGSDVTLWGQGLPVEHVAKAANTLSYELMCALTTRVALKYS